VLTSIPVPALPVTEFAAFKQFATSAAPKNWPCGAARPWTFADAAKAAASVVYALGEPSVVAGTEEDDALAQWLAFFETEQWRAASTRALRLPEAPIVGSAGFAFNSPAWGFDLGAWAPTTDAGVRQLNAWCRRVLLEFYRSERSGDPVQGEASPAPTDPAEGELIASPTINEPAPRPEEERIEEANQQPKPLWRKDVQTLFNKMIASANPLPTPEQLNDWARENGIAVRRVRDLRIACPDERLHKLGRRPRYPA